MKAQIKQEIPIIEQNEQIRWDCIAHCLNLYWQSFLNEEKLGEHVPCESCKHLQVCKVCACPPLNINPTLYDKTDIQVCSPKIKKSSIQLSKNNYFLPKRSISIGQIP